ILILLLTILLAFSSNSTAKADLPGAETLNSLRHTALPGRDPVDLARRFLGITAPPATPAAPNAYKIGAGETFTAEDDSGNKSFAVEAQLWYATLHAYWWFQVGFTPNMDLVKPSADRFENAIYPTVHKYFGSEASPGIDNDVHLFVVHAHGLGAGI